MCPFACLSKCGFWRNVEYGVYIQSCQLHLTGVFVDSTDSNSNNTDTPPHPHKQLPYIRIVQAYTASIKYRGKKKERKKICKFTHILNTALHCEHSYFPTQAKKKFQSQCRVTTDFHTQ
jgi:hypothetical protein